MESVLSLLDSTSSAFEGVPPPARRTAEARRVPRTSAVLTLICMIVNYTLSSAAETASRTARHGRPGRRRGPVGARRRRRGGRTAAAAELARAVIRVGIPGRRCGVLRIAISPRLAGELGILKAAALGERAAGVTFLRGRAASAVLRRLGRRIAAVVSLVALAVGVILVILAVVQRTVAAIEQQVAHQRVLAVEDPETGAVVLLPMAVLVALSGRGHVGETGRLRGALAFGVVLPGGFVFDGHAQVFLHGLVLRLRNIHPFFVAGGGATLARGVGDFSAYRLDLLVVLACGAAAAGFHVHQDLVPRLVQLTAQRLKLFGLLRQVRGAGLERVRRREQ